MEKMSARDSFESAYKAARELFSLPFDVTRQIEPLALTRPSGVSETNALDVSRRDRKKTNVD